MESASPARAAASPLDWFFRGLGFVALAVIAFSLPLFPALELDSSWRMAIGKFFKEGRQFGTDVVFTYGPLGWTMGKTYWGQQWTSLNVWLGAQALLMTIFVYWQAYRLQGYQRLFYFLFFFLFGLTYQDAIHMVAMMIAGVELIRRAGQPWRWSSLVFVAILAVYSLVKFTNLMLGFFLVFVAGALELWLTRKPASLRIPGIFLALFVAGWMACGQNPANLPAYLHSSWEISQGYQDAMGFSCPAYQLYLGILVAGLVIAHVGLSVLSHAERARGLALALAAGAYLYLNWKHGFIRADGHQIGFYYAALTVMVSAPIFLGDGPRWRLPKNLLLGVAGLTSIVAIELVLPGLVRSAAYLTQDRIDKNLLFVFDGGKTREYYQARLLGAQNTISMRRTREVVGPASLDVLGFEQAVAIFNGFNYQPRPVFQSYSAYTPYLARLNYDYFKSDRAPEFVLFKLQAIDGRLATMDDPYVLSVLLHRYDYVQSEQGFTLWKRKPGAFDAAAVAPKFVRAVQARIGEKIELGDLSGQNVWVEIDYGFSLLGKLRRFLFKPPLVQLRITDTKGVESLHRLPRPIGRTGFMVNPVTPDLLEFMRAAGGEPSRRVQTLAVETSANDRDCVADEVTVRFSTLTPSDAGRDYFKSANKAKFHMFVDTPISYESLNPPNEDRIDEKPVMILHSPSQMVFEVPAGASVLTGAYGFVPGAYTGDGRTNGAEFVISWSEGTDEVMLHERFLAPVTLMKDRGLQNFTVRLPKSTGHVYLRVKPGPFGEYAFDWTGWTGIEFK
jgi:hypothetical protein